MEDILLGISLDDLYQAFRQVMARKDAKADRTRAGFRAVQKDLFTVGEKMEYIRGPDAVSYDFPSDGGENGESGDLPCFAGAD